MRRLVAIAMFAAGFAGCITPSIPIPPPDPTDINATLTLSGNITSVSFTYPATPSYVGGVAETYDRSVGHGSIDAVNADGSVGPTTPIDNVKLGDNVVFTIVNGSQTVSTCVVLRDGAQDPTAYCP